MSESIRMLEAVVGLDIGDKKIALCEVDAEGKLVGRGGMATTRAGLDTRFAAVPRMRVVLEAGQHSPWISRYLEGFGHEVIVVNPYRLRLIAQSLKKSDRSDAEMLARVGRLDPEMLSSVHHRRASAQQDRAVVQSRAMLVSMRVSLVNSVRALVKTNGFEALPAAGSLESFVRTVEDAIAEELRPALGGLLLQVESLTEQIKKYDRMLDGMVAKYPFAQQLVDQIPGVGPVIAVTYVLTLDDPARFKKSRDVGAYLGLVPSQRQSSDHSPELHITKQGDRYLRSMLVQGAQYILSRGPDCDLKAWGEGHKGTSKSQRKRTVVAVARKLAVLMHHLWVSGADYDPFYQRQREERKLAKLVERSRHREELAMSSS